MEAREARLSEMRSQVAKNINYFKLKIKKGISSDDINTRYFWSQFEDLEENQLLAELTAAEYGDVHSLWDPNGLSGFLFYRRIEGVRITTEGLEYDLSRVERSEFCRGETKVARQQYEEIDKKVHLSDIDSIVDCSRKLDTVERAIDKVNNRESRFYRIPDLLLATKYLLANETFLSEDDIHDIEAAREFFGKSVEDKAYSDEDYLRYERVVNVLSSYLYETQLTRPENFSPDGEFKFIVHATPIVAAGGDSIKQSDFHRKRFISTSLISNRNLATYRNQRYGLIYSPAATDIVTAYPDDVYSANDETGAALSFSSNSLIPPTLPPDLLVNETVGEDGLDSWHYNEVLLDLYKIEPTGVFIIDDGVDTLDSAYVHVKEYAEKVGLPLVKIDLSKCREKAGLEPFPDYVKDEIMKRIRFKFRQAPTDVPGLPSNPRVVPSVYDHFIRSTSLARNRFSMSDEFKDWAWRMFLACREGGEQDIENAIDKTANAMADSYSKERQSAA